MWLHLPSFLYFDKVITGKKTYYGKTKTFTAILNIKCFWTYISILKWKDFVFGWNLLTQYTEKIRWYNESSRL